MGPQRLEPTAHNGLVGGSKSSGAHHAVSRSRRFPGDSRIARQLAALRASPGSLPTANLQLSGHFRGLSLASKSGFPETGREPPRYFEV